MILIVSDVLLLLALACRRPGRQDRDVNNFLKQLNQKIGIKFRLIEQINDSNFLSNLVVKIQL